MDNPGWGAHAHAGVAAGEHALDTEMGPRGHVVAEIIDEQIPAVIDGEEQFGRARNIHEANYCSVVMLI